MIEQRYIADTQALIWYLTEDNKLSDTVGFTPENMLDFDHDAAVPEMHDRIIAGLARRLDAPLITADSQITAAQVAKIVW